MDGATAPSQTMLGVAASVTGLRWIDRTGDARVGLALAQRLSVPEVVGRVLAARGVDAEEAESFLAPRLAALLPDPSHLKDMDVAAARLADAIQAGEPVAVFGDYDVDGATSSALLSRFFKAVGGEVRIYIPDRQREGYGPNAAALEKLKAEGFGLVVTVDCGTTAHTPLARAAEIGLEVIVIDHHDAEAGLPPALALVNPNRLDQDSAHGHLAAVGVTFLLVVAINRVLRERGWYASAGGTEEPDLRGWLDLVALGTVCDVVPLVGVNRALVTQGLKVMARRANPGLTALADVAGLDEAPGAYHLGFILGPRVNAGGRIGEAGLGARLLTTENRSEAAEIARQLDQFNAQRRAIEDEVLADATAVADAHADGACVFVAKDGWHPGVIGIVASRLKDRFGVPACVVSLEGGIGKGSGRSISGVDLGANVIAARQKGLLIDGGGHRMAAGFTVATDQVAALSAFLSERIGHQIDAGGLVPSLYLDGAVALQGANIGLAQAIERLSPFGSGNAEPRFVVPDVRIAHADVVGKDHVRCTFVDAAGSRLVGIAFRCMNNDLGPFLLKRDDLPVHVAGKVRVNEWQGRRSVQIVIDDAAPAA